jgi:hypothetical protein
MNQLVVQKPDVRHNQIYRDTLLAQPAEFFTGYCNGRVPGVMEKIQLVEQIVQAVTAPQVFANDVYRVQIRQHAPFVHLTITRHDKEPCTSWRDFQQIKNELVGPECEAVELFPAESRLVDTSNEYHLWVSPQPGYRFPVGYSSRLVLDAPLIYRGRAGDLASAGVAQTRCVAGAVVMRS